MVFILCRKVKIVFNFCGFYDCSLFHISGFLLFPFPRGGNFVIKLVFFSLLFLCGFKRSLRRIVTFFMVRGFFFVGFITHSLLSQFIIGLIVGIRSQTVLCYVPVDTKKLCP